MTVEPLRITSRTDWAPELIERVFLEIEKISEEELELKPGVDLHPNVIEIISAEQMLDAYASIGLPVHYNHWSFGKEFLKNKRAYEAGQQGLALEIVINTSPCISYLMEDNDMVAQTMVMAHAAIGHNAVFKNNVYFKEWTNAGSIIDYMIFARDYVRMCEQRYGEQEVERVLDAAHSIALHSIDKFKRKHRPRLTEEQRLQKLIEEEERKRREIDYITRKTSMDVQALDNRESEPFEEEENLAYFIMKRAPALENWKRELLRIVYKINQYFYPQSQTKVLNEGFATFTHYYIMNRLEEKGIISPDAYLAFINFHAGVINQREYNQRGYSGFNPYALGFAILQDVKRICENPTDEDREWMPHLIGRRWQDAVKEAAFEFRDDGFIMQYLSPKVIRDLRLFSVRIQQGKDEEPEAVVTEIHDEVGFKNIRQYLAQSYERINYVPQISVVGADLDDTRTLKLKYTPYKGRKLNEKDAAAVTDYISELWGYTVELEC